MFGMVLSCVIFGVIPNLLLNSIEILVLVLKKDKKLEEIKQKIFQSNLFNLGKRRNYDKKNKEESERKFYKQFEIDGEIFSKELGFRSNYFYKGKTLTRRLNYKNCVLLYSFVFIFNVKILK